MNKIKHLLAAALAAAAGTAVAATTAFTTDGPSSPEAGVTCTVDFGSGGHAGFDGLAACDGKVAYVSDDGTTAGPLLPGQVLARGAAGQAARPVGSDGNFLTVGPSAGGSVAIVLDTPANYFGFLAGSLDGFNTITFASGDTLVASYTGSDIARMAGLPDNGDQSLSTYWNLYLGDGILFDSVLLQSTRDAFETDNHAFGRAATVPSPGALALMGLGMIVLGNSLGRRGRR